VKADAHVRLSTLTPALHDTLAQLEPHGINNPRPVFVSRNIRVQHKRTLKDGLHLKMNLLDENGRSWDAIAFRMGDRIDHIPDRIDLVYTFEVNIWNGERRLQLNVKDVQSAQV
jgi:single-stranded-DNA-specific exonuclease